MDQLHGVVIAESLDPAIINRFEQHAGRPLH